jgi:hypothetical protein
MISILFLELFTPHNPQFAILLQKNRDKGLHKVVFMSGVLPEGTDVGYYVGGKVTFLLFVSQLTVFSQCKCYFVINTCSDIFLEVTRWIYKGTWDLLSLLQHSGKL